MPKSGDSDSSSGKRGGSSAGISTEPRWTLLDLDELVGAYDARIAPAMRSDGFDPASEIPTYDWLRANGYRQFIYALREHHDLTVQEFCREELNVEAEEDGGYDWGIDHEETRDSMDEFVARRLVHRDGYGESTASTHRYRLARYAWSYYVQHGTDDLLTPVSPESDIDSREAIDKAWAAMEALKLELAETTSYRIFSIVDDWYSYLVSRGAAEQNPLAGLAREFGWDQATPDSGDPKSLGANHVRALVDEAEDTREEMLVVALCAWGLRSGEIAALHRNQLALEGVEPHVRFKERKNGPGQVNIVYGTTVAQERIADLSDRDGWNGYLFPSSSSSTGHRDETTISRWFHDLADAAGIPEEIEGDRRKPHMGRRFWYDAYAETLEDIFTHVQEIAEEQGSNSARVVLDNYLSAERKRSLRRDFMRERLSRVFDT